MDTLTSSRSRLAYARFCVEVSPKSDFPTQLPIRAAGNLILQDVHYEWKPNVCKKCQTFLHDDDHCPKQKNNQEPQKQIWKMKETRPGVSRQENLATLVYLIH